MTRAAFGIVMLSWVAFAALFLLRKRSPGGPAVKRDRLSLLGIGCQGLAMALVWSVRRTPLTPFFTGRVPAALAAGGAAVLAVASVWLAMASIRTLGRQWSYQARLVEGHRLVEEGPYRFIRHPIYAALFGMMVATGLVVCRWEALAAALPLYALGTAVRARAEEALLRSEFGDAFAEYARRVPAVVPSWRRRGGP